MPKKKHVVQVCLTEEQLSTIRRLAFDNAQSVSSFARTILVRSLKARFAAKSNKPQPPME